MSAGAAPHFAAGRHLLAARRPELAERYLRRALAEEPDNPRAHAMLAECLAWNGALGEAATVARTAQRLAPDGCFAHAAAATVARSAGRLKEAEASARTALGLHPAGIEHYPPLAEILLQRRRLADSLEVASEGLRIDPRSADCLGIMAAGLAGQGRIDEARAVVRDAVVSGPESAVLHQNLGYILLLSGRPEAATAELQEALRLDPMLDIAERNLAAARQVRADSNLSLYVGHVRLTAMRHGRQAVLILAFVLAGIVAPVCWVVAALLTLFCLPPPASIRHRDPWGSAAARLGLLSAIAVLLVAPFAALIWILGPEGVVTWLGGAAVAVWLATAAGCRGHRAAEIASLAAAASLIAVSAVARAGVEPQYATIALFLLSFASFAAAGNLSTRVRRTATCRLEEEGDEGPMSPGIQQPSTAPFNAPRRERQGRRRGRSARRRATRMAKTADRTR